MKLNNRGWSLTVMIIILLALALLILIIAFLSNNLGINKNSSTHLYNEEDVIQDE